MHSWGALAGLWIGLSFDGTLRPFAATIAIVTGLLALSAHTLVRHYTAGAANHGG